MRSDLIFTSTKDMSPDDWLSFRTRGLGASEVSTVMGLNKYKSALELFWEKIGAKPTWNEENEFAFWGHIMEDTLGNLAQYWENDMKTTMSNFKAKKVIRKISKVNAYIQNPEFPHLFVSLDRRIHKGEEGEGVLELKTISDYVAREWKDFGIPLGYFAQGQTQLLVTDLNYGELATLTGGNKFQVVPFRKHESLQRTILELTTEFWRRVVEGRKLMNRRYVAEQNFNQREIAAIDAQIYKLEPEAGFNSSLTQFLVERFPEAEKGLILASEEQFKKAQEHFRLKEKAREIQQDISQLENFLKNEIQDHEGLDFGKEGTVTWRTSHSGIRIFRNNIFTEC